MRGYIKSISAGALGHMRLMGAIHDKGNKETCRRVFEALYCEVDLTLTCMQLNQQNTSLILLGHAVEIFLGGFEKFAKQTLHNFKKIPSSFLRMGTRHYSKLYTIFARLTLTYPAFLSHVRKNKSHTSKNGNS